ncbi:hypothetical protein HMPREF0378_0138 [Eubacterium nodatum ATCC 33099]|nr:hypothetical protein HMPREF0378_0138 [Eubacterium nodatum ATCC 33099]
MIRFPITEAAAGDAHAGIRSSTGMQSVKERIEGRRDG